MSCSAARAEPGEEACDTRWSEKMPENPDTAAIGQVRQHLVASLRVIDDLDRYLPRDDRDGAAGTTVEGGAGHVC